jgi:AmiR/NasT family two-component response regulator
MLMAVQRCDEDQAFDILRRASQRSNRKLRAVAAEVIERATSEPRRSGATPPPA